MADQTPNQAPASEEKEVYKAGTAPSGEATNAAAGTAPNAAPNATAPAAPGRPRKVRKQKSVTRTVVKILIWVAVIVAVLFLTLAITVYVVDDFDTIPELINYILTHSKDMVSLD